MMVGEQASHKKGEKTALSPPAQDGLAEVLHHLGARSTRSSGLDMIWGGGTSGHTNECWVPIL